MKIIEPIYIYELETLDKTSKAYSNKQFLVFVKRVGDKYPGNDKPHPGAIIQDVIRCCVDRIRGLDKQQYHFYNGIIEQLFIDAFFWLEKRAAENHGLIHHFDNLLPNSAFSLNSCKICGHIFCIHKGHK